MTEAQKLSLLLAIADRAIEAERCKFARRYSQDALNAAYADWKQKNGIHDHIEAGSPEWTAMLAATNRDYEAVEDAKRLERNADKRLRSAIYKYHRIADADRANSAGLPPVEHDNRADTAEILADQRP
ncbi:hypothetical protein [Ochrobactrum sp. CGA5]|uniref:hypothetical protein n=1 Tax=Ochrobactrum sp. CGA5 TaxID=2583453 RepID=UPI00111D4C4C|nr:hypothetical protein [Ochrobactrum sp. CGA5]